MTSLHHNGIESASKSLDFGRDLLALVLCAVLRAMAVTPAVSATNLQGIFAKVEAPQELVSYFTETCKLVTVDLFLDYVVRDNYETELKSIVSEKFQVKEDFTAEEQRLYISKARGAYRLALEMVRSSKDRQAADAAREEQLKTETDVERDLDPEFRKALKKQWADNHDWTPHRSMKAGPPLRNRCYREFRSEAMTLHMVEKALTIEDAKKPAEKKTLPLGGGAEENLCMEYKPPMRKVVDTTLGYVAALRLIMGTYSYCGSHEVPSKKAKGTNITFFPWGVGLSYCDQVMDKTLKVAIPEHAKLRWLRTRDEATRAEMVELINEGWPGGEALVEAFEKEAHFWRMKDDTVAQPMEGETAQRSDRRVRVRSRSPTPRRGHAARRERSPPSKIPRISIDKNKVKYCGAWNSDRGCVRNDKNCPQRGRHACCAQVAKGQACGRRDHNYASH